MFLCGDIERGDDIPGGALSEFCLIESSIDSGPCRNPEPPGGVDGRPNVGTRPCPYDVEGWTCLDIDPNDSVFCRALFKAADVDGWSCSPEAPDPKPEPNAGTAHKYSTCQWLEH
jgi:hypothetical protein